MKTRFTAEEALQKLKDGDALFQAGRIRDDIPGHKVVSALYHIEDGTIEWLD